VPATVFASHVTVLEQFNKYLVNLCYRPEVDDENKLEPLPDPRSSKVIANLYQSVRHQADGKTSKYDTD
jgi:hypothetical protein